MICFTPNFLYLTKKTKMDNNQFNKKQFRKNSVHSNSLLAEADKNIILLKKVKRKNFNSFENLNWCQARGCTGGSAIAVAEYTIFAVFQRYG